jgi:hypothetical protein
VEQLAEPELLERKPHLAPDLAVAVAVMVPPRAALVALVAPVVAAVAAVAQVPQLAEPEVLAEQAGRES